MDTGALASHLETLLRLQVDPEDPATWGQPRATFKLLFNPLYAATM